MIKILFAIPHLGIGGAERLVINQINHLDKEIFDPWLITLVEDPPENFRKELKVSSQKIRSFQFSGFLDIKSWLELARFLSKEKFDVVITNLFMANLIVRILAILLRVPLILSYEHNIYERKKRWQISADRILSNFTYKIIACSREIQDFTSHQEKIPAEKFTVIYNAISLGRFEFFSDGDKLRRELDLPPEVILITTAGRLIEKKGHIYLIKAAKEVVKKHNNVRFLIFGTGDLKEKLKEEINNLGLKNFVYFIGFRNIEEIMALTDIFVMPSLWEGLSMVMLEAMDAAKPMVITKVSGVKEIIKDGINGFLVEPKDERQLAEKIIALVEDKALREKFSQNAKQTVQKFSIENNVSQLKNLILSHFKNYAKN